MPRISDAELARLEVKPWYTTEEARRLIAALREAYQELDGQAKCYPYQYQPRICPVCEGVIAVGDPHACTEGRTRTCGVCGKSYPVGFPYNSHICLEVRL